MCPVKRTSSARVYCRIFVVWTTTDTPPTVSSCRGPTALGVGLGCDPDANPLVIKAKAEPTSAPTITTVQNRAQGCQERVTALPSSSIATPPLRVAESNGPHRHDWQMVSCVAT